MLLLHPPPNPSGLNCFLAPPQNADRTTEGSSVACPSSRPIDRASLPNRPSAAQSNYRNTFEPDVEACLIQAFIQTDQDVFHAKISRETGRGLFACNALQMHTYMHTHTHAHTHVHTHTNNYTHPYICTRVRTQGEAHTHTRSDTHMHAHGRTNTHPGRNTCTHTSYTTHVMQTHP